MMIVMAMIIMKVMLIHVIITLNIKTKNRTMLRGDEKPRKSTKNKKVAMNPLTEREREKENSSWVSHRRFKVGGAKDITPLPFLFSDWSVGWARSPDHASYWLAWKVVTRTKLCRPVFRSALGRGWGLGEKGNLVKEEDVI